MIKEKDYIVIHGWMVSDLNLKGSELMAYALIYGFGREGSYFTGSYTYLSEWLGLTKRRTISVIDSLVEKELITKTAIDFGGYVINRYVANFTPSEKISPPSEIISPNNNIYNNKENIYNIESKDSNIYTKEVFKKPTLEEVENLIKEKNYHFNAEAFISYYESVGWKVGKNPMKSWKSACVTWENSWKEKHPDETDDDCPFTMGCKL